jgi:hypothetical protein
MIEPCHGSTIHNQALCKNNENDAVERFVKHAQARNLQVYKLLIGERVAVIECLVAVFANLYEQVDAPGDTLDPNSNLLLWPSI